MIDQEVDWDRVRRHNYESRAFWDVHWRAKAKDLLMSAKLLEPKVFSLWEDYRKAADTKTPMPSDYFTGTYFMLLAFAVENYLKASIISSNSIEYKRHFQKTLKFPNELKDHDLVKLAKKAGFDYSHDEEDLLRRLTRSAIWFGRYPVPLNYKATAGSETFTDGNEYSVSWFGDNDVERLNSFITRLKDFIMK